ncbi:hypothetical protein GCM10011344_30820 [Dokdonia pacifica]|uniref:Uncharacterized protein n=2 Tax=Dokdonia pacifica TaxID=1627892 RepID=A0A239BTC5_9FLAO|nr:hypothetical protein GCM10011344_30820 [Dokdonia pacifica]SNS10668.1 protein of unknown function [Dokdonia pacifica]
MLILVCVFTTNIHAQNQFIRLSENAEISLITIGPGPELYDSFGHTAIRVHDDATNIDWVFNYGRFNFNTPNFYLKFARGKLLYTLWVTPYDDFIEDYVYQRRWVKEQVLSLNTQEKKQFFDFLKNNARDENREYLYDFFFDNCATRPVDGLEKVMGKQLHIDYSSFPEGYTHRDLIRHNVHWNTWGMLGMDVAIGSVTDRLATKKEYAFLPDYTMEAFTNSVITDGTTKRPLVLKTEALHIPEEENTYKESFMISPIVIIGLIALLLIYKTYKDYKNDNPLGLVDTILLFCTGLIGILLVLLWFGTEHSTTKWNYDLLWAFPFHMIASFVIRKVSPPKWIYPYMKLSIILLALLCFHWIVGVQRFAYALIPLYIALVIRYLYILKVIKKNREISQ